MRLVYILLLPIVMLYIRKCFVKDADSSRKRKLLRYFAALSVELGALVMAVNPMESQVDEKVIVCAEIIILAAFVAVLPVLEYCVRSRSGVKRIWDQTAIVLYAVVMSLLNLIRCFDNSFWGDEAYSINLCRLPVVEIIHNTALDVHPPLYYLILRIGRIIDGGDIQGSVYHLVSIIPFLLTTVVAVTLIRKEFGNVPAVILMTFAAFSDSGLIYNVEVRMYSWAAFFCLMSFYYCYEILTSNSWKYWILFMVFSLCAAYTHYYALVTVAFCYMGYFILSIRERKYMKKLIVIGTMTVISYLPWIAVLLKSFRRTAESWWLEEIPTVGDCFLFLFDRRWLYPVVFCAFVLFILYESGIVTVTEERHSLTHILPCKVCFEFQSPANLWKEDIVWLAFGVLSVAGTVAVGLLLSYTIRPLFQLKYLFPAAGIAWLCFGVAISKMKGRKLWCCLITVLFLLQRIPDYCIRYYNEYLKNANITTLQELVKLDDTDVIVTNNSHLEWTILEYYYPDTLSILAGNDTDLDSIEKDVWLFWRGEVDEETALELERQGYGYESVWDGAMEIGRVYVYHLTEYNF